MAERSAGYLPAEYPCRYPDGHRHAGYGWHPGHSAIHEQYPQVKILILTSFPEDNLVQESLEAGAIGYVLKNAPIDDLANAVRSAYTGRPTLAPEATMALIRAKTGPLKPGWDLSQREREVLALIVQGLSNEEIANRLVISPATARHHVSACIQKLGAANRPGRFMAVNTAWSPDLYFSSTLNDRMCSTTSTSYRYNAISWMNVPAKNRTFDLLGDGQNSSCFPRICMPY
jgi:DNA-binding CsgD family transcriptional regulator